jgi:hypothetical protein
MPENPKLSPEVELPRPRSSGAAVVAVAALAMFTAVGASAFVVRARMSPPRAHCTAALAASSVPRLAAERARLASLRGDFLSAAARLDDRTALEIYPGLPASADHAGELRSVRDAILARQMMHLERELASGDCYALRARVAWLQRVAPDEGIEVRASECRKPRIVVVDLVGPGGY